MLEKAQQKIKLKLTSKNHVAIVIEDIDHDQSRIYLYVNQVKEVEVE